MRRIIHFTWYTHRRLLFASSLLSIAAIAAIVGVLAFYAQARASDDDGNELRRVILVAGICSRNPAQSMDEIYQWLLDTLGYTPGEIILFDYRDSTPLSSIAETYLESDTLISIDGAGGSAAHLRDMINDLAAAGEQFDIIAHSQGGVVSLYAALDHTGQAGASVAGKIHSIVTINSPVQGISDVVFNSVDFFKFFGVTCASNDDPSVIDMHPVDPSNPDEVVNRVGGRDWSASANPYVATIANSEDPITSNGLIPDGERGVLFTAHERLLQDLGGTVFTAHSITLDILSNGAAAPVKERLMRALIEYQLRNLYLTGDSTLRNTLSRADITTPDTFTRVFMGKHHATIHPGLVEAPVAPQPLTGVYLGNGDALIEPTLAPPLIGHCVLHVGLGYMDDTLNMDFDLGAREPALWNVWLVAVGRVIPLWSVPLSAPIDPMVSFDIPVPLPSLGRVGILTSLSTSEGIKCLDFDSVDTGPLSPSAPSADELKELFRKARASEIPSSG